MGRTIPVAIMTALAVGATSIAGVPVAQAQSHPIYRTMLGIGQDESSATFSWRSDYAGQEFVRVTPVDQPDATQQVPAYDVDAGADLFDSKHAEITGLTSATAYSYQIGSDEGGWSNAYEFTTDDGDDTWNFLAFADAQIGVDLKIEENGQAWRDATRTATQTYPDSAFLMHLGDQVDGWGDQIAQYAQFFSPSEVRSYRTGVLYGNHEDYQLGQKYFDEHYNLPNETDNNANYFFEHNNALFIGINSMSSAPADIQRHQEFIRQVVAQRGGDKDWIIAGMHHAPFSQGSHTHDDDVIALREGLAPVFSEVGVDVVLSGHDHIYTRTHLMEGTVPQKPETLPAIGDRLVPTDGQVLYVTSTTSSGSKYYNFHDQQGGERANLTRDAVAGTDSELPTTAFWAQDYTPDFSNIQISPSELTVTTHNVYSPELVDEVTISKEGTPAPTTPGATIQPVAEDPSALQAKLAQFDISQDRLLDWLKEVLVAGNGSIAVLVPYYRQILNFFGARF